MDIVYFLNKLITNKTKQKAFQIFVYLFWGSSQAQHRKHVCMAMAPGYLDTHRATIDIFK